MITYEYKKKLYPVSYICTQCEKNIPITNIESDEVMTIKHTCGYTSIIEDGLEIEIHLCQECWSELFKDLIKKIKENHNE